MFSASNKNNSLSNTRFLSPNPIELRGRLKLLQEKQSGNFSKINEEEIVAIADILLEYICLSTKQHNFLLHKCFN